MLADTSAVTTLSNVLPQIVLIAAIAAVIGWLMRGIFTKKPEKKTTLAAPQTRDRSKNLEAALEKSKATIKSLKSDHEALKASAVSSSDLENTQSDLANARKSLESEAKRTAVLEADLKKAQDTIKNLNSRTNDSDKAQKDRRFTLENELSKARQELTIFQSQPDKTPELQAEVERLRESVATTTRYAGEVRKRETVALEALEKLQTLLAETSQNSKTVSVPSKKIGPVGDSARVAAAKAEVLRLLESNKQAAVFAATSETPTAKVTSEDSVTMPVANEVHVETSETINEDRTPSSKDEEETPSTQDRFALE